jgi:hypothetical protein
LETTEPIHSQAREIAHNVWKPLRKGLLCGITKNSTLKLEDVVKQAKDILSLITAEEWVLMCRHVKEVEKIYNVMDQFLENSGHRICIEHKLGG